MLQNAKWISPAEGNLCPRFVKRFCVRKDARITAATLDATALGVYVAHLNGERVGKFRLAPGWTVYHRRVQVQRYDITEMLASENELAFTLGTGWYSGTISRGECPQDKTPALRCALTVTYDDGAAETLVSDESWLVSESTTRSADIYNGELCDMTFVPGAAVPPRVREFPDTEIIAQVGEDIVAGEVLSPVRTIVTPKGEQVLDFGQEITGIVRLTTAAPRGTQIRLRCAEMLDAEGNFYTENYRAAKSEMCCICSGGEMTWEPELSYYGFRYIAVEGIEASACTLRAVVLSSALRRTGRLTSGVQKLNRLFENVIWGQKGNFLDVPTDCPQRDERLGWTGDAQVFANTACWQFDVKRFFTKWLGDVMLEQRQNGAIPVLVPNVRDFPHLEDIKSSAAWGDAATVCPTQLYRHYGDRALLASHFGMMKRWVDYITSVTTTPYLWTDYKHGHYGDWLGLDAPAGSYKGASRDDLVASAFYYYSATLVIDAGDILGEDVTAYRALAESIRDAFRAAYPDYGTQTECVLALHFGLAADAAAVTEKLVSLIRERGDCLTTGFVGTPYLLYALANSGHTDLAYTLLLQEKFPSWLYSVNSGATTIWEHWDGRTPDGRFWSRDMNSFNHYAYGAVVGWVFEVAAGITPLAAGFAEVRIAPRPDARLGWLRAEHDTADGPVSSAWFYEDGRVRYEITTPVPAEIVIDGTTHRVPAGTYLF